MITKKLINFLFWINQWLNFYLKSLEEIYELMTEDILDEIRSENIQIENIEDSIQKQENFI